MRQVLIVLCMALLFGTGTGSAVCAQMVPTPIAQQTAAPPPQVALSNQDIIKLSQIGLGPDIIITKINTAQQVAFKLETDDLVALKNAGVNQDVISAMIKRSASTVADRGTNGATTSTALPPQWTVRLMTQGGPMDLLPMTGSVSYAAFGYKTFHDFQGSKAKTRTQNSNLTVLIATASNPQGQFFLVKTGPNERKSLRAVKIGSGFGGMHNATTPDQDWVIAGALSEEGHGIWRLSPAKPLEPGEYGIYVGSNNMMGAGQLYDFGVD